MPQRTQVHVDRPLTNISVAYMQEAANFIADKVFPIVPVVKQSDTYFVYKKEDFFRDEAKERAQGAESAGGDYDIEQAPPYFCRKYAFHKDITEEERVNSDNPLQPNMDATEFVTQKMLIRRENEWASKYFQPSTWATEYTGVDATPSGKQVIKFDKVTSDPIKVIANAIVEMAKNTAYRPNTIVMSPAVFYALKNHEDILDRIKYTQKGIVTTELLAQLFEVDNIYVAWSVQNKARKGAADGAMDFIMGNHLLLCYVNPRPGIKKPSAGYIFAWTGLKGAGAYGNRITRIPMPWLGMDTERVEGEIAFDTRVVCKDLGVFFKDIVD